MIERRAIVERLAEVDDPELGINIVNLGLVYNIRVAGETVHIDLSLTYPGCPLGPQIIEEIQKKIGGIAGVKKVDVQIVWEPPWQQFMMYPDTVEELKFQGRIR